MSDSQNLETVLRISSVGARPPGVFSPSSTSILQDKVQIDSRCSSPLNLKVTSSERHTTPSSTIDRVAPPPELTTDLMIKSKLKDFFGLSSHSTVSPEKIRSIGVFYVSLIPDEKSLFLKILAVQYGVDHHLVEHIASQFKASAISSRISQVIRIEDKMRHALVPRYEQLFVEFSRLEQGMKFLLLFRTDAINILLSPGVDSDSSHLHTMNSILFNLMSKCIAVGSLRLEKITWQSSCDLLQKICAYEAVQSIRNWADLKRRVGPYKRCYAFTHFSLPREPIIVVHTALSQQITRNIQTIIGRDPSEVSSRSMEPEPQMDETGVEDVNAVTTAVFYSITSTQKGLQGIEMGTRLITRVMSELTAEFPRIYEFSSLSPVPGFRDWMLDEINHHIHLQESGEDPFQMLMTEEDMTEMAASFGCSESSVFIHLRNLLRTDSWAQQHRWTSLLVNPLMRLCARYLYQEKKKNYALNAVAHFHLRNGAILWRLNWLGDTSSRGMAGSCGIMVNYRYYPELTESNSQDYIERYSIHCSDQIIDLVRQLPPVMTRSVGQGN